MDARFAPPGFGCHRGVIGGSRLDCSFGFFRAGTCSRSPVSGPGWALCLVGASLAFSGGGHSTWLATWTSLGILRATSPLFGAADQAEELGLVEFFGSASSQRMSGQSSLLHEVQSLRRDLSALASRVLALESRLEEREGAVLASPFQSPLVINYAGGGGSPTTSVLPPYPAGSPTSGLVEEVTAVAEFPSGSTPLEDRRRRIAEEAGQFLQRSLAGDFRGGSGRDRIREGSTIYVLVKDFGGRTYNPVRVFSAFSQLKPHVKRGADCGNSIFIGWPTRAEAQICVRSAGLDWPIDG